MGQRVRQTIYECADCGRTPEDGEHMWFMCGKPICKDCVDEDEEEQE